MMVKIGIPSDQLQKRQGSLGNVLANVFVFKNFWANNYGTSSGDNEENCAYHWRKNIYTYLDVAQTSLSFLVERKMCELSAQMWLSKRFEREIHE